MKYLKYKSLKYNSYKCFIENLLSKNKFFWDETNGIRILIPKNAKQCKKLERLLIMAYEPKVNDSDGHKSSAADDCLEIISKELEELTLP